MLTHTDFTNPEMLEIFSLNKYVYSSNKLVKLVKNLMKYILPFLPSDKLVELVQNLMKENKYDSVRYILPFYPVIVNEK